MTETTDTPHVALAPGESRVVTFAVPVAQLGHHDVDAHGDRIDAGAGEITGGGAPRAYLPTVTVR